MSGVTWPDKIARSNVLLAAKVSSIVFVIGVEEENRRGRESHGLGTDSCNVLVNVVSAVSLKDEVRNGVS
jgi:hypothetical protein